jgi:hypothetical protein
MLNPAAHYRLMIEVARRRANGDKQRTAADVLEAMILKELPPAPGEVVLNGAPRRRPGRPKKK